MFQFIVASIWAALVTIAVLAFGSTILMWTAIIVGVFFACVLIHAAVVDVYERHRKPKNFETFAPKTKLARLADDKMVSIEAKPKNKGARNDHSR